jgi:hypothetical protein
LDPEEQPVSTRAGPSADGNAARDAMVFEERSNVDLSSEVMQAVALEVDGMSRGTVEPSPLAVRPETTGAHVPPPWTAGLARSSRGPSQCGSGTAAGIRWLVDLGTDDRLELLA